MVLAALLLIQLKHPVMSYAEYAKVEHGRPYVLEIRQGSGRFIYFGIGHTSDPSDKQLVIARRLWDELKPEVALNESRPRTPAATFEESVRRDGEPGGLAFWAKESAAIAKSLDLPREKEIELLRQSFSAADVKTFFAVRSFEETSRRHNGDPRTPEQVVSANLSMAGSRGLTGAPRNASELDSYWPSLKMPADWRKPSLSWFDPGLGGAGTPMNKIATASSEIRDQYMVDRILEWVASGKRVFAMMGASHVAMQERAIRAALPKATVRKLMG